MQEESAKLCFTFPNVHSMLYFPGKIYVAINQLKYHLRSCTMGIIIRGHGLEANIALNFTLCMFLHENMQLGGLPQREA